jgi:hypothetical protein
MWRGWSALLVVLALDVSGCGDDDGGGGSDEPEQSGLEADADALVSCLGDADVEAEVNPNVAFGVEADHVGVEASDLPSELLEFDSGSGTLTGVNLWVFESNADAEEARTAITLQTEDDDKSWVDGRVVVSWYYPVNREAAQAVAVDDCVGELNA